MEPYQDTKRTAGIHKSDVLTKDLYKFYISHLKPVQSITGEGLTLGSYNITEKLYSTILKDINLQIIQTIILENFEFKLPCSLGYLSIVQKPLKYKLDGKGEIMTKYLSVNYKATKDLWKADDEARLKKSLIFHTNEHTNGNRLSYWWSKKGSKVTGIRAYYFIPCRQVKRAPAMFLKDPDYKLCFFETPKVKSFYAKKKLIC